MAARIAASVVAAIHAETHGWGGFGGGDGRAPGRAVLLTMIAGALLSLSAYGPARQPRRPRRPRPPVAAHGLDRAPAPLVATAIIAGFCVVAMLFGAAYVHLWSS